MTLGSTSRAVDCLILWPLPWPKLSHLTRDPPHPAKIVPPQMPGATLRTLTAASYGAWTIPSSIRPAPDGVLLVTSSGDAQADLTPVTPSQLAG
jgi:hypothetical protein